MGSSAIFVDGGNTFSPYQLSKLARREGLDPKSTLQRIFISRAFTAYQLTQLLFQKLNRALDEYKARLVVISDISSLFLDRDVPKTEAQPIFNRLTQHLSQLASHGKLAVLATHTPHSSSKRGVFLQAALHGRADILLKVDQDDHLVQFELEKHPDLKPKTIQLPSHLLDNSVTLEDFMEV